METAERKFNNIDKLISALYLAKSANREKMLSDLVLNVLYSLNESISIEEIILFIKDSFHLEPIKYELTQCLNALVESKKISIKADRYCITEETQLSIHQSTLKTKGESDRRFVTFKQIVKDLFDGSIEEKETENLWKIFNEYLLECFMVFGRKAIDIFLPYKADALAEDDHILMLAYKKLKSDKLISIFKKLVVEYPERLTEVELRYLSGLASRAERFYSLGIEKEEYEKIKNLKITDLVVLADTNILYSVLNLHVHPEKNAIAEVVRIAKEKQIDLRIVYIPKTYTELQKAKTHIEKLIPRETYKIAHIRSLLASDKLDSFARKYYEDKLQNSDIPHPSEKITYASDLLKASGIVIYNNRFPSLEDDEKGFNEKVAQYYDFERFYNNLCEEKGYDFHLSKDDKKIEHDVFLREGVKSLKSKFADENELRFICLTLDRSLIHFDQYSLRNENRGLQKVTNPNFITPSLFIKKIRPFIPITTNDYRKAFISSLTAPTFEKEDDKNSMLIQKSMTYFKNLGIDDERIIFNCIKRELFLEEFSKHERDNTVEEFIKSEIAKEIDALKSDKASLEEKLSQEKQKDIEQQSTIEKTIAEKETVEKEKAEEIKQLKQALTTTKEALSTKDSSIGGLTESLNELRQEIKLEKEQRKKELKHQQWTLQKERFINDNWNDAIPKLRKDMWYAIIISLVTFAPIIIAVGIKVAGDSFMTYLSTKNISEWYVWGTLGVVQLFELFGRAYIFNKDRVKSGWNYFIGVFSSTQFKKIESDKKKNFETKFVADNQEPNLESE